eukprot:2145246-Amphidinium_carterae.1
MAAQLAQIEKQQAEKQARAKLHAQGKGPEPRRGQAPGAAERQTSSGPRRQPPVGGPKSHPSEAG